MLLFTTPISLAVIRLSETRLPRLLVKDPMATGHVLQSGVFLWASVATLTLKAARMAHRYLAIRANAIGHVA